MMRTAGNKLAMISLAAGWPGKELALETPKPTEKTKVAMLGYDGEVSHTVRDGKIHIKVPQLSVDEVPCLYAYTFKLTGVE